MQTAPTCILSLSALVVVGCAIYHTSGFSFTQGQSQPCIPRKSLERWKCILEVPRLGYVAVQASGAGGTESTQLSIRMVPEEGITARWSSDKITIVDLKTGVKKVKDRALRTDAVTGGDHGRNPVKGRLLVAYGRAVDSHFGIKPRITQVELRFPPVIVGNKQLAIPPVQYTDHARSPFVGPAYSE